jgi:hypothetical protein
MRKIQTPIVYTGDDKSILIEWVKDDKRFGICIEYNIDDSGWYFVSKNIEESVVNALPEDFTKYLKKFFE